jgi:hypothetical protein
MAVVACLHARRLTSVLGRRGLGAGQAKAAALRKTEEKAKKVASVEAQVEAARSLVITKRAAAEQAHARSELAKYDKALPAPTTQAAQAAAAHTQEDKEAVEIQKLKDELAAKELKNQLAAEKAKLRDKTLQEEYEKKMLRQQQALTKKLARSKLASSNQPIPPASTSSPSSARPRRQQAAEEEREHEPSQAAVPAPAPAEAAPAADASSAPQAARPGRQAKSHDPSMSDLEAFLDPKVRLCK